jgi:CheY-like chemotaxis protein
MKSAKSILVVEDDISSFQLIKEVLRPLDIEIHHVTDGQDAIDFIKLNHGISLILMDIKLPHLNGYMATTSIKESNPDIIIIAQTAFAMIGDREKSIEAGCSDHLTKPIDPKTLTKLVMGYLSEIPDKD